MKTSNFKYAVLELGLLTSAGCTDLTVKASVTGFCYSMQTIYSEKSC